MSDDDRLDIISQLTSLYNPGDYEVASRYAPKLIDDEDGSLFADFFDFLQRVYLLQGEYPNMTPEDIFDEASSLKEEARVYGYPENQLEVFFDEA